VLYTPRRIEQHHSGNLSLEQLVAGGNDDFV
jgi:hypothetical protein